MKSGFKLLAVLALLGGLSLTGHEVQAAANGNGSCDSVERASFECATFGTNTVEFVGSAASDQCMPDVGPAVPCTVYYYRYTGGSNNQLNVAIPTRVTKKFKSRTELKCTAVFAPGLGDPSTGFGKNQLTLGVCRVARGVALVNPPDVVPPPTANFMLMADPSAYDSANPLDWQLRAGASETDLSPATTTTPVVPASILGPFIPQPDVLETAVTLNTPGGGSVSYVNKGGNLRITGSTGGGDVRLVPKGGTKLCVVNPTGDKSVPYTSPAFSTNWTCETITYTTEQCDIKTDGGDPCRMIGGTCIKY